MIGELEGVGGDDCDDGDKDDDGSKLCTGVLNIMLL
jgi:hypothetical protein